ncbi:MAG: hypothetical protein AB7U83_14040 [Vicinamibacterales bacterium]
MTILLFGATGSAGGSVLRACLAAPEVSEVRAPVRREIIENAALRDLADRWRARHAGPAVGSTA